MTLISELAQWPGVTVVGEYSFRGDRFTYRGDLEPEQARLASIMCRAMSLGVHMQAHILDSYCPDCGMAPTRGWVVYGPRFTVCVVANVFCFLENNTGRGVDAVLNRMSQALADAPLELI